MVSFSSASGINCIRPMANKPKSSKASANGNRSNGNAAARSAGVRVNEHGIPDWRLAQPGFEVAGGSKGPEENYGIRGTKSRPVPPIRAATYLKRDE